MAGDISPVVVVEDKDCSLGSVHIEKLFEEGFEKYSDSLVINDVCSPSDVRFDWKKGDYYVRGRFDSKVHSAEFVFSTYTLFKEGVSLELYIKWGNGDVFIYDVGDLAVPILQGRIPGTSYAELLSPADCACFEFIAKFSVEEDKAYRLFLPLSVELYWEMFLNWGKFPLYIQIAFVLSFSFFLFAFAMAPFLSKRYNYVALLLVFVQLFQISQVIFSRTGWFITNFPALFIIDYVNSIIMLEFIFTAFDVGIRTSVRIFLRFVFYSLLLLKALQWCLEWYYEMSIFLFGKLFTIGYINSFLLLLFVIYLFYQAFKGRNKGFTLLNLMLGLPSMLIGTLLVYIELLTGFRTLTYEQIELFDSVANILLLFPFIFSDSVNGIIEWVTMRKADSFVRVYGVSEGLGRMMEKLLFDLRDIMHYNEAHVFVYARDIWDDGVVFPGAVKSTLNIEDLKKDFIDGKRGAFTEIDKDPRFMSMTIDPKYRDAYVLPLQLGEQFYGGMLFLSDKGTIYYGGADATISDFSYRCCLAIKHNVQQTEINMKTKELDAYRAIKSYQQGIAHDLKSPIYSIKMGIATMEEEYQKGIFKNTPRRMEHYFSLFNEASKEALDEIEESLSVVNEIYVPFDFEYIERGIETIRRVCEYEGINLEVYSMVESDKYNLKGPKKSVRNVVRNVLKNAIEAFEGLDTKDKRIKIRYGKVGKIFFISIWDNGKGIKKEHFDMLFNNFSFDKEGGSGQGLTLAKEMVRRMDGDIVINSEYGSHTEVVINMKILDEDPPSQEKAKDNKDKKKDKATDR